MLRKKVFKAISLLLAMCLLVGVLPMMSSAGTDITATFTDAIFRSVVIAALNAEFGPGVTTIDDEQAAALTELDVSGQGIASLAGIHKLTGLTELDCSNNFLTSLDLTALTALTSLNIAGNYLTAATVIGVAPALLGSQLDGQNKSVTDIELADTTYIVGDTKQLNGVVVPADANENDITWTMVDAGATGATITSDGKVSGATTAGEVKVLATVIDGVIPGTDFTKEFTLTPFVPVEAIVYAGGLATTMNTAFPLEATLQGVGGVTPSQRDIIWELKPDTQTNASIVGNIFTATAPGTYTVNAKVANGINDGTDFDASLNNPATYPFPISITVSTIDVTGITGLPDSANTNVAVSLAGVAESATMGVPPTYTNVQYRMVTPVPGGGGSIANTTLTATSFTASVPGTYYLEAYVTNGASNGTTEFKVPFTITVSNIGVTDITGIPSGVLPATALVVAPAVVPTNATKQTIDWAYVNDASHPTTGVTVSGTAPAMTAALISGNSSGSYYLQAKIVGGMADGTDFIKFFKITVSSNPVTGLTVTPSLGGINGTWAYSYVIGSGDAKLTSVIAPANATAQSIEWSVTPTTGLTIDTSPSTDGKIVNFSATKAGTYTLKATIVNGNLGGGDFIREFTVNVKNIGAKIDSLSPDAVIAKIATPISAVVTQVSGATAPTLGSSSVVWRVSNAGATGTTDANLNQPGDGSVILTAPKPGTLTLEAKIVGGSESGGDVIKQLHVTVTNMEVTGVTGLPSAATVVIAGDTLDLNTAVTYTVAPTNATNQVITDWRIINSNGTNSSIAGGVFTAGQHGSGTGIVTCQATIAGGMANGTAYTKTFEIQVNNRAVTAIIPNPNPLTASVGENLTLKGTVNPPDATKTQVTAWAIEGAPATATVSGTKFTATAPGSYTVSAKVIGGNADGTDFIQTGIPVTVTPQHVSNITGVKTATTTGIPMALGAVTIIPTATFDPAAINWAATTVPAGSNAIGVITDNLSANAAFVPDLPGTYTLTASIADGKGIGTPYVKTFNITVTNLAVQGITGVPASIKPADMPFDLGAAAQATPYYAGDPAKTATALNLGETVVWSIEDAGATDAAITPEGVITATIEGTVKIKAAVAQGQADGSTWEFVYTVFITSVDALSIINVPTSGQVGTPLTITGTIDPASTDKTIVWSVFDQGTTGATISGNVLTAPRPGTVMIRGTIPGGNMNGTDYVEYFSIEIVGTPSTTDPDVDPPTKTLPATSMTLKVREKKTIVTSGVVGTIIDPVSNNSKVATIDQNGTVLGKRPGNATITFMTSTGQTGTVEVKVKYSFWQWLLVIFLFGFLWVPLK